MDADMNVKKQDFYDNNLIGDCATYNDPFVYIGETGAIFVGNKHGYIVYTSRADAIASTKRHLLSGDRLVRAQLQHSTSKPSHTYMWHVDCSAILKALGG